MDVLVGGKKVGVMGVVHPEVLAKFDIPFPCTAFELEISLELARYTLLFYSSFFFLSLYSSYVLLRLLFLGVNTNTYLGGMIKRTVRAKQVTNKRAILSSISDYLSIKYCHHHKHIKQPHKQF